MQSFSRRNRVQETETLIKESLLRQLSYSVKEIQLLISKKDEVFSTSEPCNSLIVVLEAIFLHGLKKGILRTALKTVAGREDEKPQLSFWNVVSYYTHKDTISEIKKLSQIVTDVGRCRVWIRKALNDAELTSYFSAMEKDRRALNSSYSSNAFLRDRETCDTACKFLEGILTVQFEIPVNSSILNTWSTEPLMLSGIWSPPMKTPLSTGVDVAEKIEDEDDEDDSCSIKTSSSITTLSTILALTETQALKMILDTPMKKPNEDVLTSSPPQVVYKPENDDLIPEEEERENSEVEKNETDNHISGKNETDNYRINHISGKGNSLGIAHGWSSTEEIKSDLPSPENVDDYEQKNEDYNSLLEKVGISPNRRMNYEDRFKEVMEKQTDKEQCSSPSSQSVNSNIYNSYTSKLYKIVRETGLKSQKYTCAGCQLSIGLTFAEARLCYFTGEYYCDNCHSNDLSVIPSRLILNWDHKKYPVCKNVNSYLNDICSRLLIDIKKVNSKLYSAVKEMKQIKALRIQLNMLRSYLYTCKESLLIDFQKKLTPREYIYEFIDHYSINDLCQVPGGALASELSAIVQFGRNHVVNCWLCSQKGFICEICKNSKVIYPFDISTNYRCSKCYSIYHKTCLSSSKNCPKCKRLKTRTLTTNSD